MRPSLHEQRKLVQAAVADAPMKAGAVFVVVPRAWYAAWEAACASGSGDVGCVSNAAIVASDGNLRDGLQDGLDYELLPRAAFELLHGWYGGDAGVCP